MGKLFWKFFFAFWLALLIAGLAVGSAVWLRQIVNAGDNYKIDQHQAALVAGAKRVFDLYGQTAFINYLRRSQFSPGPKVYAVDKDGNDIFNRQLDEAFVVRAREALEQSPDAMMVREVTFNDGQVLLLFVPDLRPLHQKKSLLENLLLGGQSMPRPPKPQSPPFGLPPSHLMGESLRPPGWETSEPLGQPSFPAHQEKGQVYLDMKSTPKAPLALFWLVLAGLVAGFIFSFLLAWYFTRPIRALREAFSLLASGKLDTRVADSLTSRHDELSDLGVSFDEMAFKIQQLVITQQQLLHDVSHELRSPLARMQAAIGIAQQQPEKVAMTFERLEKDSQRMSDLIGELLLLSKIESGEHYEFHQVSLTSLLEEIVDDATIEAETKSILMKLDISQDFILNVQPSLLHRAIENIVRNAIKYSDPNTDLIISLTEEGELLGLKIKDQGPGLNESELEQVFKPFYRAGQRRENDSVGLGLAIATRAINSHGGYISAENRIEGGLCVTIYLPKGLIVEK